GEHDLVKFIWVAQEFVVIELHEKRNLVSIFSRARAQHTERRSDGVASAIDRQLDDVFRVEVRRIGRERRAGRVLDTLIDRKDGYISSPGESSMIQDRIKIPKDIRRPIR